MPCMLIGNQTATQQNKINSCSVGEPRLWNGRKSRNQRNKQEIVPKICYRIEHGERGITKWEKRLCSIEDINCDSIISNFINYSHQTNDLNANNSTINKVMLKINHCFDDTLVQRCLDRTEKTVPVLGPENQYQGPDKKNIDRKSIPRTGCPDIPALVGP